VTYVPDRRLVADGNIITTTGISASMPMALTLIEAIAGRAVAETTAQGLGLGAWPAGHDSDAFRISRPFALTVLTNMVKPQERVTVPLRDGIDEVSLALVADAWSRTYRSKAVSTAATLHGHESLNGLRILPDALARDATGALTISLREQQAPADVLEATLRAIATRHGQATARIVATQLEYPWMPAGTQALLPEGG
jgi:transcriptional regulator GlxA family with amidase domain